MSKFFIVLKHIDSQAPLDKTIILNDSFSFAALLLPVLWLVYHRIWGNLFVYIAISICASSLQVLGYINQNLSVLILFSLNLFIAINAHDLLIAKYLKNNYSFQEVIAATDKHSCIERYLDLTVSKK